MRARRDRPPPGPPRAAGRPGRSAAPGGGRAPAASASARPGTRVRHGWQRRCSARDDPRCPPTGRARRAAPRRAPRERLASVTSTTSLAMKFGRMLARRAARSRHAASSRRTASSLGVEPLPSLDGAEALVVGHRLVARPVLEPLELLLDPGETPAALEVGAQAIVQGEQMHDVGSRVGELLGLERAARPVGVGLILADAHLEHALEQHAQPHLEAVARGTPPRPACPPRRASARP